MSRAKPFIPRNKPKSWVLFNLCILLLPVIGLLWGAARPLSPLLFETLRVAFLACFALGFCMGIVYAHGVLTGRYGEMVERPWRNQMW
jgi:RsiW-degrading membrane proteinase PrsW (M82 family)